MTNLPRMLSRSDGHGDFLIVLPNGARLVRCANASWHPRAAVVRVRTCYHARRVRVRAMPAVGSARSWVCKVTNLSRMFSRSDGSGDFLIVLPNGVRLVRCANASWHPRAAVVRFMISCHARRVRVPCARSSWGSARPRVEAHAGPSRSGWGSSGPRSCNGQKFDLRDRRFGSLLDSRF